MDSMQFEMGVEWMKDEKRGCKIWDGYVFIQIISMGGYY